MQEINPIRLLRLLRLQPLTPCEHESRKPQPNLHSPTPLIFFSDGEKIHYTLFRTITRNTAYDCIMTMRTSQGITLQEYYTGAGKLSVRDLELSALDSDTTIAVVFKQEEK